MKFRILGPLEVLGDDGKSLALGGPKPRALLATLLLHENEVVSSDRLIEELWGERPPPTALNLLQGYVSKLRQVLHSQGVPVLVTTSPGYRLSVERGQLDLHRFEDLVREARAATAREAFDRATSSYGEALALWRGPALAGAVLGVATEAGARRLEETRLSVIEERLEAELACGRDTQPVAELQGLVAEQPLRERLRAQLMTGLYRAGRQADALAVYREGRQTLTEQLGIEPGPALSAVERAILTRDPSIEYAANGSGRQPTTQTTGAYRSQQVKQPPKEPEPALPGREAGPREGLEPRRTTPSARNRLATLTVVLAVFGVLIAGIGFRLPSATDAPRAEGIGRSVTYDFDQGFKTDADGHQYVDDETGRDHRGVVVSAQPTDLTLIDHGGQGNAVQFPAFCMPSPTTACPLVIIESPDAPDLDPGTQDFSYGADVLLTPTTTAVESNIMQKGAANGGGSQWKLRVEDTVAGTPSCVVVGRGSTVIHKAISTVGIADGVWHRITCMKNAGALTISVDSVERGRTALPPGLSVNNDSPMRIGGKNVSENNDNNQFFGALDNVYFELL